MKESEMRCFSEVWGMVAMLNFSVTLTSYMNNNMIINGL